MSSKILMPALSPTMKEGIINQWLVKVGDTVKAGDIIAEIETDKATMEVEAVDEGKITHLLEDTANKQIPVNSVIAIIDGDDSEAIENRFNIKLDGIDYDAKFVFEVAGYNLEGNELGAAFGLTQLKSLKRNIEIREKNFNLQNDFFSNMKKSAYIFNLSRGPVINEIHLENALEEIRPFLNNDGGDISLVSVENKTVKVKFEGACSTCTVNQMTLKSGVEMIIKKHVPEIEKVISVEV